MIETAISRSMKTELDFIRTSQEESLIAFCNPFAHEIHPERGVFLAGVISRCACSARRLSAPEDRSRERIPQRLHQWRAPLLPKSLFRRGPNLPWRNPV